MKRAKPFVKPLSEEAMRNQLAKLVEEGKLPSLEELSAAIFETRKKYAPRIRQARREYRAKISVN